MHLSSTSYWSIFSVLKMMISVKSYLFVNEIEQFQMRKTLSFHNFALDVADRWFSPKFLCLSRILSSVEWRLERAIHLIRMKGHSDGARVLKRDTMSKVWPNTCEWKLNFNRNWCAYKCISLATRTGWCCIVRLLWFKRVFTSIRW